MEVEEKSSFVVYSQVVDEVQVETCIRILILDSFASSLDVLMMVM